MDTSTIDTDLAKHFPGLGQDGAYFVEDIGQSEIEMMLAATAEHNLSAKAVHGISDIKSADHEPMRDDKHRFCKELNLSGDAFRLDIYYNRCGWWSQLTWKADSSGSKGPYHAA